MMTVSSRMQLPLSLGGDPGDENESSSEQSESDEDEKEEDKEEEEDEEEKEESKEEKVPPSILKNKGRAINDVAENGKSITVRANSTLYKYQAPFLYVGYLPYMLDFLLGVSSTSGVVMLGLHQGKTHKKEYNAFCRQLNDRKKFPIALSEYAHRTKQDLFNMWLDNSQDFRQLYSQLLQSTAFEAHICLILMAMCFKLILKIGGIISDVI